MVNKELIKLLSQLDPEAQVVISLGYPGGYPNGKDLDYYDYKSPIDVLPIETYYHDPADNCTCKLDAITIVVDELAP